MLSPIVDAGQVAAGLAACLPFLVAAVVLMPRRREVRMGQIVRPRPKALTDGSLVNIFADRWAGRVGKVRRIFMDADNGRMFCRVLLTEADGTAHVETVERDNLEPV